MSTPTSNCVLTLPMNSSSECRPGRLTGASGFFCRSMVTIIYASFTNRYYFNQHIFAWEMKEMADEGIKGKGVEFVDNKPVLEMFLSRPVGLYALLDEESYFPKVRSR